MKLSIILIFSIFLLESAFSAIGVPNANAPKGGTFYMNLQGEPNNIHPILGTDFYARKVWDLTADNLVDHNFTTYEYVPHLAERWEISKDNKVFTFYLRKENKFHDGTPVTAEDVKFSFDMIFDPKYEAAHLRPFFESFEKVEVVDPLTVKFYAKNTYFKNFEQAGFLTVLPKHIYGDLEKSKKMTRELIGAGPYKVEKFSKGDKIVLTRFEDWYGFKQKHFEGLYNFDKVIGKFIMDETLSLEMLKKGEIDFTIMRADAYEKRAVGAPWGSKILKVKYENLEPKNWCFYGWNFKNPIFKSQKVRVALAHLMDREAMIKKFIYGYSKPMASPIWMQNPAAPIGLKPYNYDPAMALKLLKEDGWVDADKNGVLEKKIKGETLEFKFTLIYSNKDYEKYHTWFQEDLRKVGIVMEMKFLDWSSFEPLSLSGKFDALTMAWGGGDQDPDPKQIWHSSSAGGGSNFISYSNPEVDKLIDSARIEVNADKRIKQMRKIYEKIAADAPYLFWFNPISEFYGVSSRIQRPSDTLKYKVGTQSWWINK